MNKLTNPVHTKKSWGHEIIWAITDHYVSKTIEIDPNKSSDLVVYETKEKSVIVINGTMRLSIGKCCDDNDLEYIDCPEGWSIYIGPGQMHQYTAFNEPVRLLEVASPEMDSAVTVFKSV